MTSQTTPNPATIEEMAREMLAAECDADDHNYAARLIRKGNPEGASITDPIIPASAALRAIEKALISQRDLIERLRTALEQLANDAEAQHCHHESAHRGGVIWTICDDCDAKWADDEGGFKPFKTPDYIRKARATLSQGAPE